MTGWYSGRFEIGAGGLATYVGRVFDTSKRSAQSPQRHYLGFLVIAQDVAHALREHVLLAGVNVSCRYVWWPVFRCPSMAGFGCPPRFVISRSSIQVRSHNVG